MQILKTKEHSSKEVIQRACEVLAAGGLVIFPTETTYGAGVDATQQSAVDKLLSYKSRREGKPLSIAVVDQAMAEEYVEANESAKRLYQRFLPGPVTVVSKTKGVVAQGVASEYGTLGVRIPAYPLVIDIVKALGKPMTATSANGSGEKRPYTVQDIFDGLSEKQKSLIDLVIDAGELPPNPPSTVIDTTLDTPVVFRQGDITLEGTSAELTTFPSASEEQTQEIAQRVILKHWNNITANGLVIALQGSLGVGKTIFVKGIAKFLGITETITSPTYVYVQQYEFTRHKQSGQLHHFDLWRIEKPEMIDHLGLEELFGPNRVIAVEWPSLADQKLKELAQKAGSTYLEVEITEIPNEPEKRTLQLREPKNENGSTA
jgi:L-threonylcarbamoyladenylate synthase